MKDVLEHDETQDSELPGEDGAAGGGTAVAESPESVDEGAVESPAASEAEVGAVAEPEAGSGEPVAYLSPDAKAYLDRRPAVEEALKVECQAKQELADAEVVLEAAKEGVKGKKTAYEAAHMRLVRALTEKPQDNPQLDLFAPTSAPASKRITSDPVADADFVAAEKAYNDRWNEFLAQGIAVMDLPAGLVEKLESHDPSIKTLKTLTEVHGTSEGHGYTIIDGVGKGNADKIEAAYDKLLAVFMAENPRPVKASTAAEAAAPVPAGESDPNDYDFENTFPKLINGGTNEVFDAEDQRDVVKQAIEEGKAIVALKERIAKLSDDATLTAPEKKKAASQRKKLEAELGETQVIHDESFPIYAERFGETAANRLRAYVDAQVTKKAALRGGLD